MTPIDNPLNIAIIGCGTAGPASAAFLARDGHDVTLFEQAPALGAVGAGFLLQPTGMSVLTELDALPYILEHGAPIERLRCLTRGGRRLLDLAYRDIDSMGYALGIHRATFLEALMQVVSQTTARVIFDTEIESLHADTQTVVPRDQRRRPPRSF